MWRMIWKWLNVSLKNTTSYRDDILFESQKKVLNQAKPNYLYALDTSTGKTLISIHHYLKFGNGEPLLIVAPPTVRLGGGWDREMELVQKTYGIEIDYEVLSYGVLAKHQKKYEGYFIIFDECHYVKSSTTKRGKAAYQMTKTCTNFILLSATPNANGIEDMINYFKMFGFAKNKTQFNKEYAVFERQYLGARSFMKVVDYENKEQIMDWYKSFTVTVKKQEMVDLPDIAFQDIYFKPSKEHNIIKKDRVYDDIAFDNVPKLMHGLRYYANQKNKQAWLKDFLEGTTSNVLIFYVYKSEYEAIKEIADKLEKETYTINGQLKEFTDRNEWDELENTVTIVQYRAGGAGIELQYCSEVIFYTPDYSYQDYAQALGRAYRYGQENKITVHKFVTKNTIEEDVWQALDAKESFDEKVYAKTRLGVE